MNDPERRFFFAHVQKAAGTSLFHQLQREFERDQIYPDSSDDAPPPAPVLFVSHLRERYRVRRERIRIVTGHYPVRASELLGDEFTTLTVLREPVERTLSFLRHHQRRWPMDRDRSLEELYDDPIRFHGLIQNNMVKMFSLSPEEMLAGDGLMTHVTDFTPARLQAAKDQLARVDVLGIDVRFDDFVDELTARFGWQLGSPTRANTTEPSAVAASFRRRIASDNAADVELFAFAQDLDESRRGSKARSD